MQPLVKFLRVKTQQKTETTMSETVAERVSRPNRVHVHTGTTVDWGSKSQHIPQCLLFLETLYSKKGKGVCIAIYGNPSHNYRVSLAVWDHTVLPSTRHKRTYPAFNGYYSPR